MQEEWLAGNCKMECIFTITLFDLPKAFPKINGECSFCGMIDPQPPNLNEPYGTDYRFYFYQKGAAYGSVCHTEDKGFY